MRKTITNKRKFRKTKRSIVIAISSFFVGLIILSVIELTMIFHHDKIVSPLASALSLAKKTVLSDSAGQTDDVKSLLNKYNIPFISVTRSGDIIKVQIKDDEEAWFSGAKSLENQIASLQLTMNNFTIEGKQFKRLDFRFDKPVVTF